MHANFSSPSAASVSPGGTRVALLVSVWFAVTALLAVAGVFIVPPHQPPIPTLAAIALPLAAYTLAYRRYPQLRGWVAQVDPRDLILLHSFRVVGLVFIVLYFYGHLPAFFAWPAGVGDLVTALLAFGIGTRLYQGHPVSHHTIWWWNTFGLGDFVVAVSAGVLARSGVWPGEATSAALATFPLVLIPAFVVPLYIITHIMIYQRLRDTA